MPHRENPCFNCVPDPQDPNAYRCDSFRCPKIPTIRNFRPARRPLRQHLPPATAAPRQAMLPDAPTMLDIPDAAEYRVVINRAGKRITAAYSAHPCNSRCTNARGPICQCSCGGKNHGIHSGIRTAAR